MQGSLAILGTAAAVTAAVQSADKKSRALWSLSTALMASMAPYTLLVMIPTYSKLLRQVGHCKVHVLSCRPRNVHRRAGRQDANSSGTGWQSCKLH